MDEINKYSVKNLSSNLTGISTYQDPLLVGAWGIADLHDSLWVADNGKGGLTAYDLTGNKLVPQIVPLPIIAEEENVPSPIFTQTKQLLDRLNTPMLPPQTGTLYTAIGLPLTNTLLCFNKPTQDTQLAFLKQPSYPSSFQKAFGPAYTLAFQQDLSKAPSSQLRLAMQNLESIIASLHAGLNPPDPSPTGVVINNTRGFVIDDKINVASSSVIAVTDNGIIYGFSPLVNTLNSNAVATIDNSTLHSVYKGTALLNKKLYAADFYNNKIDVFDSNWNQLSGFSFIDQDQCDPLPKNYAPFNIVAIKRKLYILYAEQQPPNNFADIPGKGNGFISIFKSNGQFVKRLVSRGALNSPWGLTVAPEKFGQFSGKLLVGNNGDGLINVYNFRGKHMGTLKDKYDRDIVIDGLFGLTTHENFVYCSSSPTKKTNGLLSRIELLC